MWLWEETKMKLKQKLFDMLISFCVCTTCITLLEGIMGILFFPDVTMDYGAFFSPPLFGALASTFTVSLLPIFLLIILIVMFILHNIVIKKTTINKI